MFYFFRNYHFLFIICFANITVYGTNFKNIATTGFAPGTSIWMWDGSFKPIEKVEPGDFVCSYDPEINLMCKNKVSVVERKIFVQCCKLNVYGEEIIFGSDQLFFIPSEELPQNANLATQAVHNEANLLIEKQSQGAISVGSFSYYSYSIELEQEPRNFFVSKYRLCVHNNILRLQYYSQELFKLLKKNGLLKRNQGVKITGFISYNKEYPIYKTVVEIIEIAAPMLIPPVIAQALLIGGTVLSFGLFVNHMLEKYQKNQKARREKRALEEEQRRINQQIRLNRESWENNSILTEETRKQSYLIHAKQEPENFINLNPQEYEELLTQAQKGLAEDQFFLPGLGISKKQTFESFLAYIRLFLKTYGDAIFLMEAEQNLPIDLTNNQKSFGPKNFYSTIESSQPPGSGPPNFPKEPIYTRTDDCLRREEKEDKNVDWEDKEIVQGLRAACSGFGIMFGGVVEESLHSFLDILAPGVSWASRFKYFSSLGAVIGGLYNVDKIARFVSFGAGGAVTLFITKIITIVLLGFFFYSVSKSPSIRDLKKKLQTTEKEYQKGLEEIKIENQKALEEEAKKRMFLEQKYQKLLEEAKAEYKKGLEEIKADNQQALEDIKIENQQALEDIKIDHQQALEKIKADYQKALEEETQKRLNLEEKLENKLRCIQIVQEREMMDIEKQKKEETENLMKALSSSIKQAPTGRVPNEVAATIAFSKQAHELKQVVDKMNQRIVNLENNQKCHDSIQVKARDLKAVVNKAPSLFKK